MSDSISEDMFHPLEIDWVEERPHLRMKDDTFHQVVQRKVSLILPKGRWNEQRPLINLSARTSLALLHWLASQRAILEGLALEEERIDQEKMFP